MAIAAIVIGIGVIAVVVFVKTRGGEKTSVTSDGENGASVKENGTTTEEITLYPCHSPANSSLETVPGFDVIDLSAVKTHEDGPDYDRLTSLPAISLSEFEAVLSPTHDVYYQITKDTRLYTAFWGVAVNMEVCDENNMTNIPLEEASEVNLIPEDSPAASATSYMHGGHIPSKSGKYRVDGYMFYDGRWHLTHQMEGIVFTQ